MVVGKQNYVFPLSLDTFCKHINKAANWFETLIKRLRKIIFLKGWGAEIRVPYRYCKMKISVNAQNGHYYGIYVGTLAHVRVNSFQ